MKVRKHNVVHSPESSVFSSWAPGLVPTHFPVVTEAQPPSGSSGGSWAITAPACTDASSRRSEPLLLLL